jgi:hypothetical protein
VDGWTILEWILERYNGMVWIRLIWLRIGTSGKCWEVLEGLQNWRLLKKGSTPRISK